MQRTTTFKRVGFAALLIAATAACGGCRQFTSATSWGVFENSDDAAIRAKAKKDPFPAADEPAVESIKR